ncbi:MAG TPA: type I glyceraldehyde-3-phosphate dehydrogenase [Campylobacteraceae bacterium]|nr:type I glyceraldehyde-3-phosphate dehydrogenase [Campylobacteraceae bacterium]HHD83261.1 type I glyceraldehyde-3-phosphate dehydrogenase [Campylobacteraceae bacterium]
MALKVAITGFGRIGRCVARILNARDDIELVAVNDTTDREMTKYLMKYDSVHGTFDDVVEILEDDYMQIGKSKVKFLNDRDPKNLDFAKYGAEVLLECTGAFYTQEKSQPYIDNGIKRVIFSAPAKDDATATFVMGVNEAQYAGEKIISNASCTTNCLAPVTKVIDDAFGIEKGLVTTVHAYTNDQNILDVKHKKDPRRARAAAVNMIPTTTGAAKAIGLVMPHLKGKLNGQSIRVPTPDVSMIDLNVIVKKETTKEAVNAAFKAAQEGKMADYILLDEDKRVSSDFIGCEISAVVAADLTQVIDDNFVKVMAWYDNEWGYSCRLVDMAAHVAKSI